MDPQSLITLAQVLLGAILQLVAVNLYLVFRFREIDPFAKWNPNTINPLMFLAFFVFGMIMVFVLQNVYKEYMTITYNAASIHGEKIDSMFWITMYVSIFVVVVTNSLLFWYPWKYRTRPGHKAIHYSHNNRIEIIWTVIPAIVLTLLVARGVVVWHDIMSEPPQDAVQLEVNGKQFAWTVRYPGADLEFGTTSVQYIDDGTGNDIGFNFEDRRGHDDLITQEIHLPVGKPVLLNIKSRDVLHSATLPHFRVKMDAVPGMPTSFWFTPTKTTAEMRKIRGDEDFDYEMSCQQICGAAHWKMRRVVVVETEEEFNKWLRSQKPFYATWKEVTGSSTGGVAETDAAPKAEEGVIAAN